MMMILKVFERLFNIDDIDCKWGVRFMFLFCVVARCAVFFNPYSDTNFTWLNTWISTYESAQTPDQLPASLPITTGNIVFLVSAFFAPFFSTRSLLAFLVTMRNLSSLKSFKTVRM